MTDLPRLDRASTGYVYQADSGDRVGPAELILTESRIELTLPYLNDQGDQAEDFYEEKRAPADLIFLSAHHKVIVAGCEYFGGTRNYGKTNHGELRIRAAAAVAAGPLGTTYDCIEGLRTMVQGLPTWTRRSTVEISDRRSDDEGRLQGLTVSASSRPSVEIGGDLNLELFPYFSLSSEAGCRTLVESVLVHTRTDSSRPWSEHLAEHRKIQELIAIAYWWPCRLTTHTALRSDDYAADMAGDSHGEEWRPTYVPRPGRPPVAERDHIPKSRQPLFWLDDIGSEGVRKWLDEYGAFGRAIWILAASLYQQHQVIEPKLLQVGTALEVLGHFIVGSPRQSSLVRLLEALCDDTDCDLTPILGGRGVAAWCRDFNRAYKGVKHADNVLPDPVLALELAEGGIGLVRLWLARRLGVERDALNRWSKVALRR